MFPSCWRILKTSLVLLLAMLPWQGFASEISPDFRASIQQAFVAPLIRSSSEVFVRMENELTTALKNDPSLTKEAPATASVVAEIYLKNQRVQEAIWALDRGGLYAQAEFLAMHYEQFLKTAKIVRVQRIGTGVTNPRLVTFANGMQAVAKSPDKGQKGSLQGETFTYELDRMAGFNLVSAAVVRRLGGSDFTFHGFIANAADGGLDFRIQGYGQLADLYLLDFLIGNRDRNAGNWQRTIGGQVFAIDHQRIGVFISTRLYLNQGKPTARILQSLKAMASDPAFIEFSNRDKHLLDMSSLPDSIQTKLDFAGIRFSTMAARPSSRQERMKMARTEQFQEIPEEIKDRLKILVRDAKENSQVLQPRYPLAMASGLSRDDMNLWIGARSLTDVAVRNKDWGTLEALHRKSLIHPDLEQIFISDLSMILYLGQRDGDIQDQTAIDDFIRSRESLLLSFVYSTLPTDKNRLFVKAWQSVGFEKKLIEKIESVQDADLKQGLWEKYIEFVLNRSAPSPSTSETLRRLGTLTAKLKGEDERRLLGHISPDLVSSNDAWKEVFQIYRLNLQENAWLFRPLVTSSKFTKGNWDEQKAADLEALLKFKPPNEISEYKNICRMFLNSPNSEVLLSIYKKQATSGLDATMAAALVSVQAMHRSKHFALETFSGFLRRATTSELLLDFVRQSLAPRLGIFKLLSVEDRAVAAKKILEAFSIRGDSAAHRKYSEYFQSQAAYFGLENDLKIFSSIQKRSAAPMCRRAHL